MSTQTNTTQQASDDRPWYDARGDKGVMRRWTHGISRRMGAVLAAAVRGCDGAPKHDPSKAVLWALRFDVLNPDDDQLDPAKSTGFMGYVPDLDQKRNEMLGSLDQYPFHFVMHLLHAAEICGYFHPDPTRREWWLRLYVEACQCHLHVDPESKTQLIYRLRDR